jgi:hypothetical protein
MGSGTVIVRPQYSKALAHDKEHRDFTAALDGTVQTR